MTSKEIEKHNGTILKIRLDTFRMLFDDLNDNQRMELIKSLIWTAPSNHSMYQRMKDEICCDSFQSTLD